MREWTRLCCAVDFSDPSLAAMHMAADLARSVGSELTLVHVVAPSPPGASDVLVSSKGIVAVAAQEAEERLARWRAEAEERSGRPVRAATLAGNAAAEILRHTEAEECDMLILGTRARRGVARVLLGSVAEEIVRRSSCPVLVVRDRGRP